MIYDVGEFPRVTMSQLCESENTSISEQKPQSNTTFTQDILLTYKLSSWPALLCQGSMQCLQSPCSLLVPFRPVRTDLSPTPAHQINSFTRFREVIRWSFNSVQKTFVRQLLFLGLLCEIYNNTNHSFINYWMPATCQVLCSRHWGMWKWVKLEDNLPSKNSDSNRKTMGKIFKEGLQSIGMDFERSIALDWQRGEVEENILCRRNNELKAYFTYVLFFVTHPLWLHK